jgi:Ca-activated chloride channel family protein
VSTWLAHPEWLWPLACALAGVALATTASAFLARRRRRLLPLPRGGRIVSRALASDALLLAAVAAVALALLGPRIGERTVYVPASGVDVVFTLDVSRSMDARDVPPSRLARARRATLELLARLEPADRAALAAFAGAGVLLTPLTPDREVLSELLSGVDTGLVAPGSSDLAAGVRAALGAFEPGSQRARVIAVVSDGEDPERRRDVFAAEAARAGARVVAVAIGTEAGATLDDHGVPLVDASGGTVVSRRDRARLAALAEATGGALFASDAWGDIDFAAALAAIRRDAGAAGGAPVARRVPAVRVLPFAALAFALLLVEGLPRGPLRLRAWRRAAAAAGVLLAAAPSPAGDASLDSTAELEARVRARPDDPAGLIALGSARLARGQRDAAVRAFTAAALRAREPGAAAVASFDLGVAHLERGDLPAARDAFLDALAFDPDDEEARFNLEWTLVAEATREPPPPAPPAEQPPRQAPPPPPDVPVDPEEQSEPELRPPEPAPLSPAQQQRLLGRIADDPAHALRAAAGGARGRTRAGVPVW